ncbi:MAG: sulfite exporter TauE/SafE family protein [Myxococcota bacterium]|nr:sulfite exporter TauE/SafE family protein [Myxococcota bacterium]
MDLSAIELGVVVGAGLAAGFINTVAGGGSLLTLPALMLAGIPPTVANGTNRVMILMQTSAATYRFDRAGVLERGQVWRLAVPTVLGAGVGAYGASVMSDAALEPVIFAVLICVAAIFAFRPGWVAASEGGVTGTPSGRGAVSTGLFFTGLYGGFLQAGVGFVLLTVLAGMLRMDLARANALKSALVIPYTVVALAIFGVAGQIDWGVGASLGVSSVLGAWLGVHVTLERTEWLRWLVLGAVTASAIAVGWQRVA